MARNRTGDDGTRGRTYRRETTSREALRMTPAPPSKTVLVTGTNSGIGLVTCLKSDDVTSVGSGLRPLPFKIPFLG